MTAPTPRPSRRSIQRAVREPGTAFSVALALAKGQFYKWFLPLIGRRFTAGRNFRVFGRLVVRGSGRVVFGDDVSVRYRVTPFVHHRDALITVGDGTKLVGTRFGCALRISVGRRCRLANCHILDTDFHPTSVENRDDPHAVRTAPVEIGDNVWIGDDNVILPGTTIGDNCVTSVMTVCSGKYAANMVIVGNPGRAARKLATAEIPTTPADPTSAP